MSADIVMEQDRLDNCVTQMKCGANYEDDYLRKKKGSRKNIRTVIQNRCLSLKAIISSHLGKNKNHVSIYGFYLPASSSYNLRFPKSFTVCLFSDTL